MIGGDTCRHRRKHVVDVLRLHRNEHVLRLAHGLGRVARGSDAVFLAEELPALFVDLADEDLVGLGPAGVNEATDEGFPHLAAADDRELRHGHLREC